MSAGTVKPTDARIFVSGNSVVLVCPHCGFKQVYAEAVPGAWDMSHLCKRNGGMWLVVGQEEIKVSEGRTNA